MATHFADLIMVLILKCVDYTPPLKPDKKCPSDIVSEG